MIGNKDVKKANEVEIEVSIPHYPINIPVHIIVEFKVGLRG
jgi:hypothetical protein